MPDKVPQDIFSVMSILSRNSDKNFVQRIMNREDAPKSLYDNEGGEAGPASSHSMAADMDAEGNWYVYPTVIQGPDGELRRLGSQERPGERNDPNEAWQFAHEYGEVIPFGKDKDAAIWFSSDDGYKRIWEDK
jgi:hypothetical protein